MPFRSKAQVRKFRQMVKDGEMTQAEFDKWARHTADMKNLPERADSSVKKRQHGKSKRSR